MDLVAATPLSAEDREILARVESTLNRGRQLRSWFDQRSKTEAQWFPVAETFNPADRFLGLFGRAEIDGKPVDVMGAHQDVFFDRPRTTPEGCALESVDYMSQTLREFTLAYYLRLSELRSFKRVEDFSREPLPALLNLLSWRPENKGTFGPSITLMEDDGFGFRQVFYKLRGSGEIGRFPDAEQVNLVDMRQLGVKYDWLVLRTLILNADMTVAPFGRNAPQVRLPIPMSTYLALDRGFIDDEPGLEGGVKARYGVGYAMIRDPASSVVAYGPGHFDDAIQINRFDVLNSGEVRARLTLVGNQPKAVMNVFGFDPLFGYIRLANLLTGGFASRRMEINRERVVKFILFNHCCWVFNSLMKTFRTYHEVPDWLAPESFPEWVRDKVVPKTVSG